jgi:diacylglycerol kinase
MVKRPARSSGRAVSRVASVGHALRGLGVLLREPNAQIHVAVALGVTVLGLVLGVSALEWCALALAMTLVLGAEALNTAIELVVDMAQPEWHALARDAKDVAAAAVLVCSVGAAVVGLWVLGPKLWALLG